MSEGYIVVFSRKDGKADEEFYYNDKEEAKIHFDMFEGDVSGLYSQIEIRRASLPNTVVLSRSFV